jgi:hypothetical protein
MNLEQQIVENVGFFACAGWADGHKEPYEFTDIDRAVAAGFSLNGKQWGREGDTWGIAGVVNGISNVHQAFLNDDADKTLVTVAHAELLAHDEQSHTLGLENLG